MLLFISGVVFLFICIAVFVLKVYINHRIKLDNIEQKKWFQDNSLDFSIVDISGSLETLKRESVFFFKLKSVLLPKVQGA